MPTREDRQDTKMMELPLRFIRQLNKDVPMSKIREIVDSPDLMYNLAQKILQGGIDNDEEDISKQLHKDCVEYLGDNFVSLPKMQAVFGSEYGVTQSKALRQTAPDYKKLFQFYKLGNVLLFPSLSEPVSVKDLMDLTEGKVIWKVEVEALSEFLTEDLLPDSKWCAQRMVPVENAFDQSWEEQSELLPKRRSYVPSAPEALLGMLTLFLVQGELSFTDVEVRTSSQSSKGNRVTVGRFHRYSNDIEEPPTIHISDMTQNSAKSRSLGLIESMNL